MVRRDLEGIRLSRAVPAGMVTARMNWPFDLPKKKMVLTSRRILEDGAPIYYVSHDVGGEVWQFHPHEDFGEKDEDVKLATLKSVFLLDESIGELGDLPEGWHAWREAPDAEWQREKIQ